MFLSAETNFLLTPSVIDVNVIYAELSFYTLNMRNDAKTPAFCVSSGFSELPRVSPETDDPAEVRRQHITATVSLPGTWNDGKWCSAAVCRSCDIESSK